MLVGRQVGPERQHHGPGPKRSYGLVLSSKACPARGVRSRPFFVAKPPDAMETFTVTIDGEEYEISADQIQEEGVQVIGPGDTPEGFVDKDVAEENKRRAVNQATEGMVSVEEAAQNDQVVSRVLDEHGPDDRDVDPDDIRESVMESEVQPREERIQSLESGLVEQALTAAAQSLGVKKEFLRGETPYILHEFGNRLEYDPERNQVVATDEDGNLKAGENGVAGPEDLLREYRDSEDYAHLFGEPKPQGSGGSHDPGQNGSTGGNERFTRQQVAEMDSETYEQKKDQIHEQMADNNGSLPEA